MDEHRRRWDEEQKRGYRAHRQAEEIARQIAEYDGLVERVAS
jgi:hypothetical protein